MRVLWSLVTVAACLYHNYGCTRAAPTGTTDEILLGQIDIDVQEDDQSNEITAEPFEKKCIADGKSYSHAEVVYYDANSRCICVAGNVYCFWHGLPPPTTDSSFNDGKIHSEEESGESRSSQSTESACQDSPSLSNDTSDENSPLPSQTTNQDDLTDTFNNNEREKSEEDVEEEEDDDSSNEDDDDDASSEESTEESVPTSPRTNPPITPITCVVLDRTYRVGEVLPHNTGNCIECSCGPEGHVVCAPRDCVSIVPHRDYREENFQIPIAGDLRGIDENF
ncbi:uncharacterized protein [Venturia canescens]|uniref:uncharacterized protein n=1 Tax=Venturia canescens TaxID=32260 RepID=UPI001C9C0B64|nr:uncharacterized protein LOC122417425 [Venturia canescens]